MKISHDGPTEEVPPPDSNQVHGFLVLYRPDAAMARWSEERHRCVRDQESLDRYLNAVRRTLDPLFPSRYRGTSRYPIERYSAIQGPAAKQAVNERAERRMLELLGPDPSLHWSQPPWFDSSILPSIEAAREILSLGDDPASLEIARVSRGSLAMEPETLGFDIGYWGGDHFSLVADTVVMPQWHPCPEEDLVALQAWSLRLNENVLFSSRLDAEEFRDWYVSQPWAERDFGEEQFQIIRIDAVD